MKNKSRVLTILLTLAQMVIAAMAIILAVHDLFVPNNYIITNSTKLLYVIMIVMGISLLVTIINMIVAVKWKEPKTIFGMGLVSIFGFNLGAGLVMALSADKK